MDRLLSPGPSQVFAFEPFLKESLSVDLYVKRAPVQTVNANQSNVCKYFLRGSCHRGAACSFVHPQGQAASVVCKHYLRGLCSKGDLCEFLHEYNLKKMPECWFFTKYGECSNPECLYLHIDPATKIKPCPWYIRGFCKHGQTFFIVVYSSLDLIPMSRSDMQEQTCQESSLHAFLDWFLSQRTRLHAWTVSLYFSISLLNRVSSYRYPLSPKYEFPNAPGQMVPTGTAEEQGDGSERPVDERSLGGGFERRPPFQPRNMEDLVCFKVPDRQLYKLESYSNADAYHSVERRDTLPIPAQRDGGWMRAMKGFPSDRMDF